MPGLPLVSDFDGTLAVLDVDWAGLRSILGVDSILDLWNRPHGWDEVTTVERAAGRDATIVPTGFERALGAPVLAILTNNSEGAVEEFLGRHPGLRERVVAIIGRETLGGPKNDRAVFGRGFELALESLASYLGEAPTRVQYQGDQDYELQFAAEVGAVPIDVRSGAVDGGVARVADGRTP